MERQVKETSNCITYTYADTKLSKEEMLGYIIDIMNDDDITANGLVLVAPEDNDSWDGTLTEIPSTPDRDDFVENYKDAALTCVTAVIQYHGQQLMITYRPETNMFSVILPKEFKDTIDDVEKNVIPDAIDENGPTA